MRSILFEEWVVAYIAQADAMNDIRSVLANISASTPRRMINWIINELIDFLATGEDDVPLLECIFVFHIYKVKEF